MRVAILSDNNKEWLFCDLGVLCAAGISTGIYPTDSPAQVEYLVNDCKAKFLFVENEEQLDKILAVRERTPHLKKIVVFDMEGLREFKDPQVMPLSELTALGEAYARRASPRSGSGASPSPSPATSPSSSTPRAPRAPRKARCSPIATSSSRAAPSSASTSTFARPTRR